MSNNDNIFTCCICGRVFEGFGNNPWPISKTPGDRCCNDCDAFVVRARILGTLDKNNKK